MIVKIAIYVGMSTLHAVRFLPSVIIFAHYIWGIAGADMPTNVMLAISYVVIALIAISVLDFWLFAVSTVLFIVADLALMWVLAILVTKVLFQVPWFLYFFNAFAYWVLLYGLGFGIMLTMRKFLGLSKAM